MAKKLKNLKIKKVDFVDQGANPDAHIGMAKRKEDNVAAGSKGGELGQNGVEEKNTGIWKKMVAFIAKAAGMGQEEIDTAIEEIQKSDSVSFNEKLNEAKNRKIADEIWDLCYALQSSLCSILNDEELDSTGALSAMQGSVEEFCSVVKDSIQQWSEGKAASLIMKSEDMTDADLEIMKSARDRLTETIEKTSAVTGQPENGIEKQKGDDDMGIRIDKSMMTSAERAFYEDIEKRCGVDDGGTEPPAGEGVEKKAGAKEKPEDDDDEGKDGKGKKPDVKKSLGSSAELAAGTDPADIYKGLHPAVKAELESLKKFRQDAEDREIREVAKRYTIIGKKEDELFPVLKSMKAAGGTAYHDMIAVLDQAVETVEKSGAFSEIGKAGHGSNDGGAWAEAEVKASEIMKSKTGITKAQALDEVFMADPGLAERCEKEE